MSDALMTLTMTTGAKRLASSIMPETDCEGSWGDCSSSVDPDDISSDPGIKALVEFAWERLGRCHCDEGSGCDACQASDALRLWEFGS